MCKRLNTTSKLLSPDIKVTLFGMAVNVVLLIGKIILGFLFGSIALVADGIHSGSDMFTDIVVLWGICLGKQQPDRRHTYGHGRYETLAGGIIGGFLITVGLLIIWKASSYLYTDQHNHSSLAVLLAAAGSIVMKEWIFHRTIRVARQVKSAAMLANAWHHRSDSLSSAAVLLGGAFGLLGWGHADQVAGILVGIIIVASGARILAGVFHELMEGGLSAEELGIINEAIMHISAVEEWHQLRTRRLGRETFLDVHIVVNSDLLLQEAHDISMQVEKAVRAAFYRPINMMVHVEPDTPDIDRHQNHA